MAEHVTFKAGSRFGRLVLRQRVRESPKVSFTIRKQWLCDCDCGKRVTVPEYYLRRVPNPKKDCGECHDLKTTKTLFNQEYRIWLMMLKRTTDPRHVSYKYYGGRGIIVCPEWSDPEIGFDAFLSHIGARPSERHTVDRFPDPDGDYAPYQRNGEQRSNVRWATAIEQANNKSKLGKVPTGLQLQHGTNSPQSQSDNSIGQPGMETGTEIPKEDPTSETDLPKSSQ